MREEYPSARMNGSPADNGSLNIMSTRALVTFIDDSTICNVYKHYDGYPSYMAEVLAAAHKLAWPLPRFEADEFAAAFCAAAKSGPGGVRVMPSDTVQEVVTKHCSNIEYRYELFSTDDKLHVRVYSVDAWNKYSEQQLFDGTFAEFEAFALTEDA